MCRRISALTSPDWCSVAAEPGRIKTAKELPFTKECRTFKIRSRATIRRLRNWYCRIADQVLLGYRSYPSGFNRDEVALENTPALYREYGDATGLMLATVSSTVISRWKPVVLVRWGNRQRKSVCWLCIN